MKQKMSIFEVEKMKHTSHLNLTPHTSHLTPHTSHR
jgi:hypothetical protein